MSANVDRMAYVGEVPWHGLGATPKEGEIWTVDDWIAHAGLDWEIKRIPVEVRLDDGRIIRVQDREVLYRADTLGGLSVVSSGYEIVQPRTVIEFFRETVERMGLKMETAGSLAGGRIYWALVKLEHETDLGRRVADLWKGYILLSSSCDKSMSTTGRHTSRRPVCENTLTWALQESGEKVKVPHSTKFDADAMKRALGIVDYDKQWETLMETLKVLQTRPVSDREAEQYFTALLRPPKPTEKQVQEELAKEGGSTFAQLVGAEVQKDKPEEERVPRGLVPLMESYLKAPGAVPGTAYGLLQGVTHYIDHVRGRDQAKRLKSAWFGQGDAFKQRALDAAVAMV